MKPTLFLSHAAKDSRSVGLLKDRLVILSSGAIDIFLSSDGQSIPFGRNWVHQVEEALNRAKLMFVFLSPAALQSRWVSFESGFAYAKGILVVPVGILGVDLASVGPPLGLLQGFNIASAPAMNNLIKTINSAFEYSCKETLTAEDYQDIFLVDQARSTSLFGEFSGMIYDVVFQAKCVYTLEEGKVVDFLRKNELDFYTEHSTVYLPGLSFSLHKGAVDCRVDPLLSARTFKILELLIPFMAGDTFDGIYRFSIKLSAPVRATEEIHRLSARIYGSELKLDNDGRVKLGSLRLKVRQQYEVTGSSEVPGWKIGSKAIMTYRTPSGVEIDALHENANLSQALVGEALRTLFQVGVLFLDT